MTEMYKYASLVVPVTLPSPLGSNISLDASSNWHTSALLASAIETVTLPSRLRTGFHNDTYSGIASLLNQTGKQSIAGLQMSVPREGALSNLIDARQRQDAQDADTVMEDASDDEASTSLRLDLDFTPTDQLDFHSRQQNGSHQPRIFSQIQTIRSSSAEHQQRKMLDPEEEAERLRRRNPNKPLTRQYHSSLAFPLLDSFPRIFRDENGNKLGGRADITASLTTDASVSARLKLLRTTVLRSIGVEDREVLGSELADMADEYHEGWDSGSDEGDDD